MEGGRSVTRMRNKICNGVRITGIRMTMQKNLHYFSIVDRHDKPQTFEYLSRSFVPLRQLKQLNRNCHLSGSCRTLPWQLQCPGCPWPPRCSPGSMQEHHSHHRQSLQSPHPAVAMI